VEFDARTIRITQCNTFRTKNGRDRVVPIHGRLMDVLERYRCADGYIVKPGNAGSVTHKRWSYGPTFRAIVESIHDASGASIYTAGRGGVTAHTMRHTWQTHARLAGIQEVKIKHWGGWSVGDVAGDVYTHFDRYDADIERLYTCDMGGSDADVASPTPRIRSDLDDEGDAC
jgi:integrase